MEDGAEPASEAGHVEALADGAAAPLGGLEGQRDSPTDAMWAGAESGGASLDLGWDELDEAGGMKGGDRAASGGSACTEVLAAGSLPADGDGGGGLHFDVGAWEKGMGDVIKQVGLDRPEQLAPLAERVADAQNRMRILEEDRDILRAQSVKLQHMLDAEREDRHTAQKAQQAAVEKLRELDHRNGEMQERDANRLQELQDTAVQLQHKLEKARRAGLPAADVVDSLRKRTLHLEEVGARKDREQLQWQREMGKKLALTLKVLQLQKEHADQVEEVQDSLHRLVSQAAAEASSARARFQQAEETVEGLMRQAEAVYSEETRRNRDLLHLRSLADNLLTRARAKNAKVLCDLVYILLPFLSPSRASSASACASRPYPRSCACMPVHGKVLWLTSTTQQLSAYQSGLQEDLKSSEYERRLHEQLVAEYQVRPLVVWSVDACRHQLTSLSERQPPPSAAFVCKSPQRVMSHKKA